MSRPEFEEMQTTVGYDVHMEEAWGRAYMEERIGDFFMKNVKKREVGGGKGIFGGFLGG